MTMDKHARTSRPAATPYKRPRKPLMSKSERERQAKTLITYRPGGGDIA